MNVDILDLELFQKEPSLLLKLLGLYMITEM